MCVGVGRIAEKLLSDVLASSDEGAALEWGSAALYASDWNMEGLEGRLFKALYRAASVSAARDMYSPGMGLHTAPCSQWTIATRMTAVHSVVAPSVVPLLEQDAVPFDCCRINDQVAPVFTQITAAWQRGYSIVCCTVLVSALQREQSKTTHFKLNRVAGCSLQFILSDLARVLDKRFGTCSLPL